MLSVISAIATAIVAALGGYLAAQQIVTIGVVVAFFAYARQFFNAVSQLSSLYSDTQSALAGGERVFALLDTPVDVADAPGAERARRASRAPSSFGVYGSDTAPATRSSTVSTSLFPQVRPSPSWARPARARPRSSTSCRASTTRPSGAVLIDGHDLRDVRLQSVRRSFGIVLQDPFLFSGTIADNIRYGDLDATDADVREAARVAGALDFIESLPDGFDTQVAERGATLSTGQRQLIAFARAIVGDPAILILDEATSSVDTRTEVAIQTALRRILAGRTALIIAHRLSTIRDADRILVVDAGRVVEDGTYAQLLAGGGPFAALARARSSTPASDSRLATRASTFSRTLSSPL